MTGLARPWVLVSAALAPVALIGGWTAAAARQPAPYSSITDTISALAATGARDAWVMTTGLAVLGGCHVVTALGLVEARPAGRLVLGVGGVAAALVAVFPQPSAGHFPAATLSFVALAAWPAASGLPSRRAGVLATVALSALLGWLALEVFDVTDGRLLGLSERVVAGAQALWPLAVVLWLSGLPARGAGTTSAPTLEER